MDAFYAWLARLVSAGFLPEALRHAFVARGLLAVLILAPLLGGLSHVVVARRLAFFSSALGHAALTGITLGLLAGEPISAPYAGMFGFCLAAAIGMVWVKRRSSLSPDTLIGVFMSLTLGLGVCLLVAATKTFNIHQIEGVMFGSLLTVTDADLALLLAVALGVVATLAYHYNALFLDSLDTRVARVAGVRSAFVDYLFVVLLTLSIVVSLKVIGALLVEALVVVPAAAARNVAKRSSWYFAFSVVIAAASGVCGIFVSSLWAIPTGGAVVLVLSALFFVTLAVGAARRKLGESAPR
jgi:zinc transport system permease protein